MISTGNVSFGDDGFRTIGYGGGRVDVYEPTDVNWGPEKSGSPTSASRGPQARQPARRVADGPSST